MNEPKVHFKLYKSKTKWMVAGITMFSLLAFGGTAQADQIVTSNTDSESSENKQQPDVETNHAVALTKTNVEATDSTDVQTDNSENNAASKVSGAEQTTPATTPKATTKTPEVTPVDETTGTSNQDEKTQPAATPGSVEQSSGTNDIKSTTPAVKPAIKGRAMLMRAAVAPTTAVKPTDGQLVYDNAPIDEWMPNQSLQAVVLKTLQGSTGHWDNNFLDPQYGTKPGAKTWNSVADITKSDMLLLKAFALQTQHSTYIDGKTSYSIEGLQYATNLQSLDLLNVLDRTNHNQLAGYWHGDITDLSPIKNLTNLTFLQFSNNRVSDISALANMKKLTYLSAVNNEISDFSMLDAKQFDSNGLNIFGQDIMRAPVYLKKGQDTVLISNLGVKLPKNYNAAVGHYAEPTWSAIDVDYWSWYTWNPNVLNVYRRGANGTAVGDDQVQFKVIKSQVTPGPIRSEAATDGIGVHQQPYTYYLVAGYYDAEGNKVTTYYIPYVTDAAAAAAVTVHYVDQTGKTITADTVLTDGAVGQPYATTPKTFKGYTLDQNKLPANATGTFGEKAVEVTYVYDQDDGAPVTVTYVDEQGATLADPETLTGKYGDPYTAQAKQVSGYMVQKVQGQATGTFTDQAQQVVYVYAKTPVVTPPTTNKVTVTVHYQTADGTKVAPDEILTGNQGDTYTTKPATASGYQLVTTPANAQGVFGPNDSDVTYVYAEVTDGGDGDQVVPTTPIKPKKPVKPSHGQQSDKVKAKQKTRKLVNRSKAAKTTLLSSGQADRVATSHPANTNGQHSVANNVNKSKATTNLPQTGEQATTNDWGVFLLVVGVVAGWLGLKRRED